MVVFDFRNCQPKVVNVDLVILDVFGSSIGRFFEDVRLSIFNQVPKHLFAFLYAGLNDNDLPRELGLLVGGVAGSVYFEPKPVALFQV